MEARMHRHRSAELGNWRLGRPRTLAAAISLACVTSLHAGTGVVFSEDFSSCTSGGFTTTGLWHAATLGACSPGRPGCGLYFGLDGSCNYSNGFAVGGGATSPSIDLTNVSGPITLAFDYRVTTENFPCSFDKAHVRVSDDGFATSTLVADNGCSAPVTLVNGSMWSTASIDLSAWAGSVVQVRFAFDSVDDFDNGHYGFAVTNIEVEGVVTAGSSLSLEGVDCQDDVFPGQPGHQVAIDLWMRDVEVPGATGFQAFVEFDVANLDFRDDLSSYTGGPFSLHILNFGSAPPFNVEWSAGRIRLDGSNAPLDPPTAGDAKLATLVFDVLDECATTDLGFGGYPAPPAFFSELSRFGVPLATGLVGTGTLALDDTPPSINCPADITVAADVSLPLCIGSDCCSSQLTTGCSDAACTATVCGFDLFCCNVQWDSICASEATGSCGPVINPCSGAIVGFAATANDNCTASPTIAYSHASGSLFPIGTTVVTATATDECGNSTSCTFDVTVTPTNLVLIDVQALVGSFTAPFVSRCIHFQTDSCSVAIDESVLLTDNGLGYQTSGSIFIEMPCGAWSDLCVKDEQHSKWATVPLTSGGTYWQAAAPAVLLPGDDDNDGDVDINDVTWLIFTYSSFAAANPCPFDFPGPGPRDADFSLNGAVSGEDYSLLTDQFLTTSSCVCTLPSEGGAGEPGEGDRLDRRRSLPIGEVDSRIRNEVDLNRDGVFDADDVLLFEVSRGFPTSLSDRMRAHPQQAAPKAARK